MHRYVLHSLHGITLAPGASEAILRLSLRKSFTQNQIDVGYPGSYANEVFKIARSQQNNETVFDITKYILSLEEEKEITTRVLLPLPNVILTTLHYCLPLFLVLQFATFLAISVAMQGDDYWLRGWVIRDVSLKREWINRSSLAQTPLFRFVPIMREHVSLRSHLWYTWSLMVLIYLPLAIIHAIFVLEQKNEGPSITEFATTKTEERKLSLESTQGDVIPDLEDLTKEMKTTDQPPLKKNKYDNKGEGGDDNTTQIKPIQKKRKNLQHKYKVQRPLQALTLLLLVVSITLMSYSLYVTFRYSTYYAMESVWRDLITSWISSTMNEYYIGYPNQTDSETTDQRAKLNSLDEMHMTLGCCGASGYQDWQNVTKTIPLDEFRYLAYPPAKNTSTSVVPYSCCKWMEQSLFDICDHTSGDTNSIYTEGCTERLVYLIIYKWLQIHFWSLIAVNCLMIPQVLLYLGAFQPIAFYEQFRSIGKKTKAQKELAMRVAHQKKKKKAKASQDSPKEIHFPKHQNRG
ncbi:hypothetical protein EGR_04342 [Echinococcus granulosus]|uniref:Uncharacterized protein n=1 Tax=Echinococcus granulosus TaxID=6210 RepID=W6UI02_ECHGR|nr:hypothetical protein EGR_04342 [Echinococcus granulosus]EUB60716.1 hypothetical protein EGR_04342 [Echinococcus granulosus]